MSIRNMLGVLILASIPLISFLISVLGPNLYVELVLSGMMSESVYLLLRYGPFCALTVMGLALYVVNRREFWKSASKHFVKTASILLVCVGLFFVVAGAWGSVSTYGVITYYSHKGVPSPLSQLLVEYSPLLLFFMLWLISGLTLLADGIKALKASEVPTQTRVELRKNQAILLAERDDIT